MKLCLASTSVYRKALLDKLCVPFSTVRPDVDETPLPGEDAHALVKRLSEQKAKAVSERFDEPYLIIGSDQVACLGSQILGKPGDFHTALQQLQMCRNKTVRFLTGLAIFNSQTGVCLSSVEPFDVSFKNLTDSELSTYLKLEQPYDCAGSFKSEGLGITLFSALNGRDPNSLIGLPLISLQELLLESGFNVFDYMSNDG